MAEVFNWLFGQYATYSTTFIILELIAVVFGIVSVILGGKTNIWVYPIGLVSTAIFVYLLWKWQLFGDMLINFYYSVMSIYGWYNWSQNRHKTPSSSNTDVNQPNTNNSNENNTKDSEQLTIERINARDLPLMLTLSALTVGFVALVYYLRPVINNGFSFDGVQLGLHLFTWVDYTDMVTTALFLMAMVLMARRKIENWLIWIVADTISVPLYFYKGFTFTAIQYIVFTLIAIFAYREWRRRYHLQNREVNPLPVSDEFSV